MLNPLLLMIIAAAVIGASLVLFWPATGVIPRWRSMRRVTGRVLREDTLKHIQKMVHAGKNPTLMNVAGAIGVDRNLAMQVLTDLEESGLLVCEGETIRLTPDGESIALNLIRAHRLWEQYLAEHSGFDETEWHLIADEIEHTLTPEQIDELAISLGHPVFDPHGDPIPSQEGEVWEQVGEPLSKIGVNTLGRIVHVSDEPETVAAQIVAEGLYPGMVVRVTENDAQRVRFWVGEEEHVLAPILAANIAVVPIEDEVPEDVSMGQPLNGLKPGEKGQVVSLSPRIRGAERRRMMDLGILPGTVISPEFISPGGDPTAYRIRDALIAIRGDQAQWIRVEPVG
ncbi:MAG: metal-dependent transcriptional regulator [Anaerolineales bacterium]|jgi:DtxR family Mn-dependent transcriptional regulator